RARDVYRFQVEVPKGKSASQTVTEEHDITQAVSLSNSDDQTIRFFQTSNISSAKVQDALKRALELKTKLSATQRDLQKLNQQLADITNDQTRLRANLKEMPPTAAAYKRYLDKFDKQETEIEKLQAKRELLQQEEHKQRTGYEAYLMSLDVQ